MTITYARQYRPVSTSETATNDALSVRFVRDMADAVNNYARHVANFKPISQLFIPSLPSTDSSTIDGVMMIWPPVRIPKQFTTYRAIIGHKSTAMPSGGTTAWILYCSQDLYRGPSTYDSSYLSVNSGSATVTTSSTTYAIANATGSIVRNTGGESFFFLAAQNSLADNRSALYTLDVTVEP